MPRYQAVPILGGCYSDSDRAWSLQDTVNWLPEQAEQSETRTPSQFKTPPGLRPSVQVSGPNGGKPVRGTYNCENKLFAAIGKSLYQITNKGVAIEQGTIPGNTRVTMTHNQISQGNQLVVANGSSGYVFNTLTQVYEKILDEAFPGAIWVGFADGYILGIEPGRRFAFNSEPADALNYNALDRFTSEYKPDLIVTGIVNNNELILLNETSYEFFENTGASQQPFRSKRIYGDVGCASRYGACNLDRTVFMFGADGKFYRLEGYSWVRISTRPIEQAIRGLNWSQCFATIWEDGGHSVVRWTFPDGMTWCFDQSTQLWHRMKSLGLDRYRISTSTQLGQDWYCGDFQSGRIWVMDWDYILEGEDEIERERVTGVLSDNQNLAIVNRLELLFATGQQETVPVPFPEQPEGPTITGSAPDGTVSVEYAGFAYTVTPGDAPIASIVIRSGTLPPGVTMTSAGILSTTDPTAAGSYTFTIRATDTNGLFDDHTDTIVIEAAWEWVQSFGNDMRAIASDDTGHIIAAGNGISNVGELWITDEEAEVWTPIAGIPVVSIWSIAWGRIGGTEYWVAGDDTNSVLLSNDRVTWNTEVTANANANNFTLFAGDRFMRLGFNGNCEYATNPTGTWQSVSFGSSDARAFVADPDVASGSPYIICVFLADGTIRRSTNGGVSWSSPIISGPDPHAATGFAIRSAALVDGVIHGYKYINSTTIAVYSSPDNGVTFTATDITVTSNIYNGGPVASMNGELHGVQNAASPPNYVQLFKSTNGLAPFTALVLIPGLSTVQNSVIVDIHDNGDGTGTAVGVYNDNSGFAYRYLYGGD